MIKKLGKRGTLGAILSVSGLVLVFLTAAASDRGCLTMPRIIVQLAIGAGAFIGGGFYGGAWEW